MVPYCTHATKIENIFIIEYMRLLRYVLPADFGRAGGHLPSSDEHFIYIARAKLAKARVHVPIGQK